MDAVSPLKLHSSPEQGPVSTKTLSDSRH